MCIILIIIKIIAIDEVFDLKSISAFPAEHCAVFAPEEGHP
jgi:hypothetical protein